jgi:hypothetical protein
MMIVLDTMILVVVIIVRCVSIVGVSMIFNHIIVTILTIDMPGMTPTSDTHGITVPGTIVSMMLSLSIVANVDKMKHCDLDPIVRPSKARETPQSTNYEPLIQSAHPLV